jgi:hypothetical protein
MKKVLLAGLGLAGSCIAPSTAWSSLIKTCDYTGGWGEGQ